MKLVLFEDIQDNADRMLREVNRVLSDRGDAVLFSTHTKGDPSSYDDRLKKDLTAPDYSNTDLLIVDSDLTGLDGYPGLSEPTVWRVADAMGIPECGYARGEKEGYDFSTSAESREAKIVVSVQDGDLVFANQVVSIADGFSQICKGLKGAIKKERDRSLGVLMSTILGKSEYSEKFSLYASGDQNRLANIVRLGKDIDAEERLRRWTCTLGYWLWDSILRYPGIVVNEIAASSYLDMKSDAFTGDVRKLFNRAVYQGPFADAKEPLWWRGVLDDILSDNDSESGREYAEQKLNIEIPLSQCLQDPSISAGYYCMIRKEPVSLENSRAGLSWFPRGADLARISNDAYEEIGPWL